MRQRLEVEVGEARPVVNLLAILIQAPVKVSALLRGVPGIGKTTVLRRLAKSLNLNFVCLEADKLEFADIMGLPYSAELEDRPVMAYRPPAWLIPAVTNPTLLVFDELDKGTDEVRRALLSILLEYRAGYWLSDETLEPIKLHPKSFIVGAFNPPECGGKWELSEDVVNRCLLINFPVDISAIVDGLMSGDFDPLTGQVNENPLPYELPILNQNIFPSQVRKWQTLIASFLNAHRNCVVYIPTDWQGEPIATPRSWVLLARVLGAISSANGGRKEMEIAIKGLVGKDVGLEFLNWLAQQDLPDPAEVLSSFKLLPKRPDAAMATLASIVALVDEKDNYDLYLKAWQLALFIEKEYQLIDLAVDFASWLKSLLKKHNWKADPIKAMLKNSEIAEVWFLTR